MWSHKIPTFSQIEKRKFEEQKSGCHDYTELCQYSMKDKL